MNTTKNNQAIEVGNLVKVFDDKSWREAGGDKGDNSCFYVNAKVLKLYKGTFGHSLADVLMYLEGGKTRESKGHFVNGLKKL